MKRSPPPARCCCLCNPEQCTHYGASNGSDPRLKTFAAEFSFPLVVTSDLSTPSRPSSPAFSAPDDSENDDDGDEDNPKNLRLSKNDRTALESALLEWRDTVHAEKGSSFIITPAMILPQKKITALVKSSLKIASTSVLSPSSIHKITPLQILPTRDLESLISCLTKWKGTLSAPPPPPLQRTPKHLRHHSKKARLTSSSSDQTPRRPLFPLALPPGNMQPAHLDVFGSTANSAPGPATPKSSTMHRGQPASPHYRQHCNPEQPHLLMPARSQYYRERTATTTPQASTSSSKTTGSALKIEKSPPPPSLSTTNPYRHLTSGLTPTSFYYPYSYTSYYPSPSTQPSPFHHPQLSTSTPVSKSSHPPTPHSSMFTSFSVSKDM